MPRRPYDFYVTPMSATLALMDCIPSIKYSTILEPCAGDGAITKTLATVGHCETHARDLDPKWMWEVADARYAATPVPVDYVVSNFPFTHANEILKNYLGDRDVEHGVISLLRLSFLEPTKDREWLAQHPPSAVVVLPRISFTNDGRTDSVTCAWMMWSKFKGVNFIKVYSKNDLKKLVARQR